MVYSHPSILGWILNLTSWFLAAKKVTYAVADSVLSPKSSEYIRSTSVNVFSEGDGMLLLENKFDPTRIVDKLGIITLEIQAKKTKSTPKTAA